MIRLSLIQALMTALILTEVNISAFADRSCLDGNILIDKACYDPHFERATTYENAKEICEEGGGQVALAHNTKLQKSLAKIALKQKFDNYWIQTSNELMSSDSCHSIMSSNDFEVSEEHCNNGMFYICEFDFEVSNSLQYGNKHFQLSDDRRKFTDALTACSNIGGKLAQVGEDELNFLTKNLRKDQTWERFSNWQLETLQFGYYVGIWNGARLGKYGKLGNCERFNWGSVEIGDCEDYNFFVCQLEAQTPLASMEVPDYDWDTVISLVIAVYVVYLSFLKAFTQTEKESKQRRSLFDIYYSLYQYID